MKSMLNVILKIMFCTMLSMAVVQGQGIEFFDGSWDEVLAEAKKKRRLVFVDAYTTWCGPCKMMARNTFTDSGVGEFHNENFINYKFDMEKGEGLELSVLYDVKVYPALLFVDSEGNLLHRAMVPDPYFTSLFN